MNSYKDLAIYKTSRDLAIRVHRISLTFPKFEQYEEGSQIRRSSKAVTCLIVEGYGRKKYKPDFLKYLNYAHAECDETLQHLDFLHHTDSFPDKETYSSLKAEYEILSKSIYRYIMWVEDHFN
jgi:four helix bundle protein